MIVPRKTHDQVLDAIWRAQARRMGLRHLGCDLRLIWRGYEAWVDLGQAPNLMIKPIQWRQAFGIIGAFEK